MPEERVQKILARAGYGSRRASEELISAGRVKINGQTATLGSKADAHRDTITIDNQAIEKEQPPVYIAVNKPQGVLSEVSPEEPRETVRDLVPVPGHMFIVGRLDLESEGLILLTNDGDLANKLSHPRYGHEKEYHVLVGARPDDRQLEAWRHGVVLEDGYRTAPAKVRLAGLAGKGAWLEVILHEGRKRQIREMGKQTGLPVLRILRVRIGTLLLGDLKPGAWRELRPEEIRALKANKTAREPGRAPARARRQAPPRRAPRPADRAPRLEGRAPRPTGRAPRPTGRAFSEDYGEGAGEVERRPYRPSTSRPPRGPHRESTGSPTERDERHSNTRPGASRNERPSNTRSGAARSGAVRSERPTATGAGAAHGPRRPFTGNRPSHRPGDESAGGPTERSERRPSAGSGAPRKPRRPSTSGAASGSETHGSRPPRRPGSPSPRGGPRKPRGRA